MSSDIRAIFEERFQEPFKQIEGTILVLIYDLYRIECDDPNNPRRKIAPGLWRKKRTVTLHEFVRHIIPSKKVTEYKHTSKLISKHGLDTPNPDMGWVQENIVTALGYPGPAPEKLHTDLKKPAKGKQAESIITYVDIYKAIRESLADCLRNNKDYKITKDLSISLMNSTNILVFAVNQAQTRVSCLADGVLHVQKVQDKTLGEFNCNGGFLEALKDKPDALQTPAQKISLRVELHIRNLTDFIVKPWADEAKFWGKEVIGGRTRLDILHGVVTILSDMVKLASKQ